MPLRIQMEYATLCREAIPNNKQKHVIKAFDRENTTACSSL
jgi:hypothetical protein